MQLKSSFLFLITVGMTISGCAPLSLASTPQAVVQPTPLQTEQTMVKSIQITDVHFSKAFYNPGETVRLTVQLKSEVQGPTTAQLVAQITHLTESVHRIGRQVTLKGGEQAFNISWDPPTETPRGYGVDLKLQTLGGEPSAYAFTAFDVLEHWTQVPRYGFLTDFFPNRNDITETMASINRNHINALQFYDWMYRHDQFMIAQEPYTDPLGRTLSRATVESLIAAAHEYNIAAMPYTAVYAASMDFYHEHPDWAIFGSDGKPLFFGENFLVYMDPRPGSPWNEYLLNQFDQILEQIAFDGIHLDQYGDPKVGYDHQGNAYKLDTVLAKFIDATHQLVIAHRPKGAVVFNAVTNWPIETVAPSAEDIVYIEVWPPYTWFNELHQLILQSQELGNGKAVVLAAYLDPEYEHNVRLVDAIIFASGGGHIELGEQGGMLSDAYFPKYKTMSSGLTDTIRRYYDFAIRYEEVTGPPTKDATRDYLNQIEIPGASTNLNNGKDIVMPIVRERDNYTAINLVNLLGIESPEWERPIASAPTYLDATTLNISGLERRIKKIWMASPDSDDLALHNLPFSQSDDQVSIQFPGLAYWSMVLIEWES